MMVNRVRLGKIHGKRSALAEKIRLKPAKTTNDSPEVKQRQSVEIKNMMEPEAQEEP